MTEQRRTTSAPIIRVPGFWLGAWAWDEVAEALRADGHDVTAITLPGLESAEADRSSITMSDHVNAIVDAIRAQDAPVVLAVHRASGFSGYAASDRIPEGIAAMVYVDSAPGMGALDPDFDGVERPLNWEEVAEEENLDGLSQEQKATFRERAIPVPGGVIREGAELTNDSRRDIPSTLICTRRSTTGPGSRASVSCATSPGSTCRRATGRCGRARRRSRRSSATSRRRMPVVTVDGLTA